MSDSNERPRLVMSGAAGRMGRSILSLAESEGLDVVGALEHTRNPFIGSSLTDIIGQTVENSNLVLTDRVEIAAKDANVLIDFSSPENTVTLSRYCSENNVALVVGTTGFSEEQKSEIEKAAINIPVLISPNMSLGVNFLFYLTGIASSTLHEIADIEVTEVHHRHKKDSPSGTAVRLKNIILENSSSTEENVVYGREGLVGERPKREIAVHAIRGGDVVGDHTVSFYMDGERVELTHKASSRETFARGALKAARALTVREPGLYSMKEIFQFGQ